MTELPILSAWSQIQRFFLKTRKNISWRKMLMIIEHIVFLTQIGEKRQFKLFTAVSWIIIRS